MKKFLFFPDSFLQRSLPIRCQRTRSNQFCDPATIFKRRFCNFFYPSIFNFLLFQQGKATVLRFGLCSIRMPFDAEKLALPSPTRNCLKRLHPANAFAPSSVSAAGSVISVNLFPEKAFSFMFVTLEGEFISVRTHPEKHLFQHAQLVHSMLRSARDSQFWNVPASISVTISGTVKERRLVQFAMNLRHIEYVT